MATALADLSEEIKCNIVHNIKKVYLSKYLSEDAIRNVLIQENWDLTKAVHVLNSYKSYKEKNDNNHAQQTSKKKNKENKCSLQSSKNKTSSNDVAPKKKKNAQLLHNEDATDDNDWVFIDCPSTQKTVAPKKKQQNKNESSHGKTGQENSGMESKQARKKRLLDTYNRIKLFREPIDRINDYMAEGIKLVVLMRGCSGSGKTTFVKQILRNHKAQQPGNHIFSTDNYFLDDGGIYHFHGQYLQAAHEWNQKLVGLAMGEGRSPIFVDNTNTRLWEMRDYAMMAVEHGYVVETLEPPSSWFYSEEILHKRSSHLVPRESIRKMLERYEANISGNDLLLYLRLNYKCSLPQAVMSGLSSPISKQHMKVFSQRLPQSAFTSFGKSVPIARDRQNHIFQKNDVNKLSSSVTDGFLRSESVTTPARGPTQESFQSHSNLKQNASMSFSYFSPNQFKKSSVVDLIDFSDSNEKKIQVENSKGNVLNVTDTVLKETQNLTYPLEEYSKPVDPNEWNIKKKDSENSASGDEKVMSESDSELENETELEEADDDSSEVSLSSVGLEYVLISEDNLVTFQKEHSQLANINTLEDFKKTSNALLFSNEFDNFLKIFLQDSGFEGNDDSRKIFPIQKQFIDDGSGEKNLVNSESEITNEWESSSENNLKALQRGSSGESFIGDWDYKRELPKEIHTELPKENREPIRKCSSVNASTNTNYLDFEVLKGINSGSGNFEGEVKVIEGNPDFISIPGDPGVPTWGVRAKLMLDKGSMTSDIETSQVVMRDSGIERLVLMFPSVSRENLEELFDKCQRDIDWTVGLLLDSNHEMSELYTSMEPIECTQYEDNLPETNDTNVVEEPLTSNREVNRKCRKKKTSLSRSDHDLYKQIHDKIVLNEDHYSDHMKRLYQIKTGRSVGGGSTEAVEGEDATPEEMDMTRESSDSSLESDEDVVFMVDSDLVMQLQSRFGGMLRPNMIGERTVVYLPLSLARQLHSYVMDSVNEQMEEQNTFTEEMASKDEELALRLHEQEFSRVHGQPTLQEIMDEEVALRKSQIQKEREGSKSMAGKLSLQLLIERFPQMDPTTLSLILEDTNNSLHQATQLLTTAGHTSTSLTQKTSTCSSEEQHVLSREEAIIQAKAYEDVSSQLYELRKDCLNKAQTAYREGNKTVAVYYSQMAKWYMERIEKSNSIAAKAILYGYEGWTTLDLHFLQVNEALNVLDLFVDEVIRGLQESKGRKAVVYIITGRGNHSVGGRSRLKPAVKGRLSKRELQFFEQNPGMLKVIIPRSALISYNRNIEVTA